MFIKSLRPLLRARAAPARVQDVGELV